MTTESLLPVLHSSLSLPSPELVDAKTWYDETYASCGSWDSWVWETVKGRDYGTRKPHFNAFVSVTERLDNSSAQIVSLALREGRLVLGFNQGTQLLSISGLRQRDDEAGGWAVSGTPIQE